MVDCGDYCLGDGARICRDEVPPQSIWVGGVEGVDPTGKHLGEIKLDTGALTSSMDAKDLERFEKDNQRWVRFNVEVKDSDDWQDDQFIL